MCSNSRCRRTIDVYASGGVMGKLAAAVRARQCVIYTVSVLRIACSLPPPGLLIRLLTAKSSGQSCPRAKCVYIE